MTTTDARKRSRDMRDAHETARERDEAHTVTFEVTPHFAGIGVALKAADRFARARDAAWTLGALDETSGQRDRTHDDQETDMTEPDNSVKIHVTIDREQVREAARLAAELFITEYASRLVEAVDPDYLDDEPVEDCGCPPRVHVNPERTDWLDEPVPVPRPEAADITEEPPVGSQVTDGSGEVWERHEVGWALWWPERSGWVYELLGGDPSPWPVVRNRAPLRPTTDADRDRVGLAVEPAPADVGPDEALGSVVDVTDLYAQLDKAQADLARVTWERDGWKREAERWQGKAIKERAKADRYDALRADVAEYVGAMGDVSAFTQVQLLAVRNRLKSILAADANRDTKRAES